MNKVQAIYPRIRNRGKANKVPADFYSARILRLEELLTLACNHMITSNIEVWPTALNDWYEKNVPLDKRALSYDEAYNQLTPEQITALGLDDDMS